MNAQRGQNMYSSTLSLTSALDGVGDQSHAPADLSPERPGTHCIEGRVGNCDNPYPTAFPYGNGTVLHFYQQQENSTTKTVHKVINKGLKAYV